MPSEDVKQCLTAMRKLLEDPKHWIKGATAKDKNGKVVFAEDKQAMCWCLYGALNKCAGPQMSTFVTTLQTLDFSVTGSIVSWNDHPITTHEEVLELLDKAIAQA